MELQCPECRSYKVVDQRKAYLLGGSLLALFSLPWVWLIFPIILVFAGLALVVASLIIPRAKRLRCRGCGFQFPRVAAP